MDNTTDLPALFADCLLFDFKSILTSPARLGSFLSLCRLVSELEEEAKHAAIALALDKAEIPGWTLVRREGSAYVEAGAGAFAALSPCHVPGASAADCKSIRQHQCRTLHRVSASRGDAAWVTANPDVVKKSGAVVFLRKNNEKEGGE